MSPRLVRATLLSTPVLLVGCLSILPDTKRPDPVDPPSDDTDTVPVVVDTDTVPDDTEEPAPIEPGTPTFIGWDFGNDTVAVYSDNEADAARTYTMTTSHPLRDNLPPNGTRTFTERSEGPTIRTGDLLFDALFAMAVEEAAEEL